MSIFIMIAKTVFSSVISAAALAAIIGKIETMINPPHPHLSAGMVILLNIFYAVIISSIASLIGALIWRNSLDENWLKIVLGAVVLVALVFVGFYVYVLMHR